MKLSVGAAETVNQPSDKRQGHVSLPKTRGSGNNPKNGGGSGGGNNGNNRPPENFRDYQPEQFHPDKFRIIMWFLLLVVVMTFGALISAYVVIATNGVAEWQPFNLPYQVWISTALILISSLTYQISNKKIQSNQQNAARKWLLVTTAVGAVFIASQILLWLALVKRGYYLQGNQYAGFFYVLTIVHAVHVAVGIITLGYLTLRIWQETASENEMLRRQTLSKVVGWYWHLIDALWLLLILLLGFWK